MPGAPIFHSFNLSADDDDDDDDDVQYLIIADQMILEWSVNCQILDNNHFPKRIAGNSLYEERIAGDSLWHLYKTRICVSNPLVTV